MRHQIAVNTTVTQVDATAQQPIGSVQEFVSSGLWQTWVYVFNDEAATAFAQGTVVAHDASTAALGNAIVAPADCPTIRVIGVAQHAIAAGSYGWVLARGVGEVLADGSASANTALDVSGTAGQATSVGTATDTSFAWCTEDDAGAGTLVTCLISCQGV